MLSKDYPNQDYTVRLIKLLKSNPVNEHALKQAKSLTFKTKRELLEAINGLNWKMNELCYELDCCPNDEFLPDLIDHYTYLQHYLWCRVAEYDQASDKARKRKILKGE
jgi:hypothetical protein